MRHVGLSATVRDSGWDMPVTAAPSYRRVGHGGAKPEVDVVVVGSGPNGLAAAAIAASAGLSVHVFEEQATFGGGARTESILNDESVHDLCSHAHPLAVLSPFFKAFDLSARGVELCVPDVQFGQPVTENHAVAAYRSLDRTCAELGPSGKVWRTALGPLAASVDRVAPLSLSDFRSPLQVFPEQFWYLTAVAGHMVSGGKLGPASSDAAALMSGASAHAMSPLTGLGPAAVGVVLSALAHGVGWPIPRGGSGQITSALIRFIEARGGQLTSSFRVTSLTDLPRAKAIVCDTSPRSLVDILGPDCPSSFKRQVVKFRHSAGVSKVDFLLSEPVPWLAESLRQAGTVHVGGPWAKVAAAEEQMCAGVLPEDPFMLFGQPSVVDDSRALGGQVTFSGYVHVPLGWSEPVLDRVCRRLEVFAPGFRDVVVAAQEIPASRMSGHNRNYIGGDISCGAVTLPQVLARPRAAWNPYATPVPGVYLCSAATPPGPGVHGMCGVYAMRRVLRDRFSITDDPLDLIAQDRQ